MTTTVMLFNGFARRFPSNSLACLYGLAMECGEQKVLGDDVEIEIHAFDETNTNIQPETNHFAHRKRRRRNGDARRRAVKPVSARARYCRAFARNAEFKSASAAFTFPARSRCSRNATRTFKKRMDMGVSLFAGEAEGRLAQVLIDAYAKKLEPLYNFMDDLPNIEGVATPVLPAERVHLTAGATTSFDAGRGCPFRLFVLHDYQCSGTQIAPPLARRHRKNRSRKRRARSAFIFYHGRQFRPQQGLGNHSRQV